MIVGTTYGVALNDREQLDALAPTFGESPYGAAPSAPVLYVKPRNCIAADGARITLDDDVADVAIGATIALVASPCGFVTGRLAIDVFVPHVSFHRPAIAEQCRDGFLPLGLEAALPGNFEAIDVVTAINGVERHRWCLARLARGPEALHREIGAFMTLLPGDLLLPGIAGDAPVARRGDRVHVSAAGVGDLSVELIAGDGA